MRAVRRREPGGEWRDGSARHCEHAFKCAAELERAGQAKRSGEVKIIVKGILVLLAVGLVGATAARGQAVPKNVEDAINEATNFVDWVPDSDFYPKENAKQALDKGKLCVESIDDAAGKGLAASTVVDTYKGKMTIAEAREMCVSVRDKGGKFFGELTEKEESVYRPFRAILTGDKLRIYNDRLKKYKLYGAGGKVLKTPEEYRDSILWCTTGVDREGIVPVWSVDCWHFKGMAMVGTVTSKTGTGDTAPSSAFR